MRLSYLFLSLVFIQLPVAAQTIKAEVRTEAVAAPPVVDENIEKIRALYEARTLLPEISREQALGRKNRWQTSGIVFDIFHGIKAYGNVRNGKYQCTELVHRFLNNIYGVPTKVGNGMGHAKYVLQNFKNRFGGETWMYSGKTPVKMNLHGNKESSEPPAPASVINFKGKTSKGAGHTAVVRYVEFISSSEVRVYLFEQHGFPELAPGEDSPIRSLVFKKSAEGTWGSEYVMGIGQTVQWINFTTM